LQERLGEMHDADLRYSWLAENRAASQPLLSEARRERAALTRQLARELESWRSQDRFAMLRRSLWD
jgi:CHAD domain-containing protein